MVSKGVRQLLEKKSFPVVTGYETETLAFYYFGCLAVLKDQPLADDLESFLVSAGKQDAAVMGKKMAAAIMNPEMKNPSDVMPAFIKCVNILFANHFQFALWCVRPIHRGHILQQIAIVFVELMST